MKTPVGATRATKLLSAVIFVIAVQAQTAYTQLTPTSLKLSPNGQGELTGTSAFSLSSAPLRAEKTFVVKSDAGLLHILCTWESDTPLTVSLARAAGHGLHGTIFLTSRTAQSPISLEVRIEPEQASRGPIYVEVRTSFQHGGRETVHGSIFATIGTTVFEKAIPYRQSVRNDLQEGKLLSPSEVTAMEAKLRANPQDWTARLSLLGYYWSSADLRMSKSQIIAARLRHILWTIENRPTDSDIFDAPELNLAIRGPLADPDGAKKAEDAWQIAIAKHPENTHVSLNAALFSATTDPAFSERVLQNAKSHADDDSCNRALGWLYAMVLASGSDRAFAEHAQSTLATSTNPALLVGAAPVLAFPAFKVSTEQHSRAGLSRPKYLEFSEDLATRAISSQPDDPYVVWTYLNVLSVDLNTASSTDQRLAAEKKIYELFHRFDEMSEDPGRRLLLLPVLAGLAFDLEDYEAARKYAIQSLDVAKEREDIVAGVAIGPQAIHDSNDVLGRIALHEQKVEEAKDYLLKAAETPGGGILSTVGPRMLLAQALLDRGEREVVIEYLQRIKSSWRQGAVQLDQWIAVVRKSKSERLNLVDVPILASYR
jgi:tetratricopeptide (TPR) repeat protein